ncbi:MAG: RagB/SusD family nutrient uptake outer membrane protein, partial [Prolixibacteraceae bacterium]|nr:RagB/SusD family nutrient uptake outer membrane protein [Prolixibacteraceae bacterium]
MKKRYIILFIALYSVIACNDSYLEKFPLDKINDAGYWKTAKDIELFANQFYIDLKLNTSQPWLVEDPTDNDGPAARDPYSWNESTLPVTGGGWAKADWAKIRSCNIALDHIATMEKSASIQQNEGEIRFFRAFYYFAKVKYFGDVPWLEHNLNIDSEDLNKARDPRKLVVDNLLKDLDIAIANLPATSATDRLTKYAALTLKAEVCLYEGTFRKYRNLGDDQPMLRGAVDAASTIMSSGLFSLYKTGKPTEDYFNLFIQDELKGNPEGIMVQRYMKDLRFHTHVRVSNE